MTEPARMDCNNGSALIRAAAHNSPMPDAAVLARFRTLVDAVARYESPHVGSVRATRSIPRQEDRPEDQRETVLPYFPLRDPIGQAPCSAPPQPSIAAPGDVAELLWQFCSELFVGDASSPARRVWLALDATLPGAAAEFIRDGAVLRVILHARNAATLRLMTAQCDSLHRSLAGTTELSVQVAVVGNEGLSDGSAA